MNRILSAAILAVTLALVRCSTDTSVAGTKSGSETTNGFVASITYSSGTPAAHAVIRVRPRDYLADTNAALSKLLTLGDDILTDSMGRFTVESLDTGAYLIEAADATGNAVVIPCTVLPDSMIDLGAHALAPSGTIAGTVGGLFVRAFVRVRGLERCVRSGSDGRFSARLPAGQSYMVNFLAPDTSVEAATSGSVLPAQTVTVSVDLGTYRTDSLAVRAFLDNSGLGSVPVTAVGFAGQGNRIRTLRVAKRGISQVHPSIGSLAMLWEINLDSNSLSTLPNTLSNIPHLTNLSFAANPMDSLPMVVTKLPNLRMLTIDFTRIKTLPDGMSVLTNLEVVWMTSTGASTVPPVLFSLPKIFSIRMKNNSLISVPTAIGASTTLNELDFSGNQLDSLPASIGNLRNLTILFLYGNRLTGLPASIGNLTKLNTLNVEGNRITSLPVTFGNLDSLRAINIGGNAITDLPASIVNLTPVQQLYVGGNKLCLLTPDVTAWINSFTTVDWLSTQTCP